MKLHRLPYLFVPRFFAGRRVRRYVSCLTAVPAEDDFCMVQVATYGRPFSDTERRAGWGHNIPDVTRYTTWAASERAVAILSEEAAHFGWHFHVPMRGVYFTEGSSLRTRHETNARTARAVSELVRVVTEEVEADYDEGYRQDLGAKGRRALYLSWATRPDAYALGVRVQRFREPAPAPAIAT